MPCPFPGMDPFLEQDDVWQDFHGRFLAAAAEAIGPQVQPDFIVKLQTHLYVRELPEEPRRFVGRADLAVASGGHPLRDAGPGVGLAEAPATVRLPALDVVREHYIEIRDRRSRDLVCVIELLSPSNKRPGPDREQYLAKRRQVLGGPAHLVEIDLLRGGVPMPAEGRPPCDYSVMVSRSDLRPEAGFWSIGLRDPLPAVPIPLRPPHGDARLDLRATLDRVYDAAGYAYDLHASSPSVPLAPADLDWARALLPPG
ncbi:MAG: DUF4058 family protein [Thermoleophilia bacterium]|nr:DUF4058 family protein [Thermoleophilia bacterium]